MEGFHEMPTANKAEIDTSSPFRSVKEAVMLFGERVLAGEVYANYKLKEMQDGAEEYDHETELEVTRQSLVRAREESMQMAKYLSSLQQELEQTKRELNQLKTHVTDTRTLDLEVEEDLKFVEESNEPVEHVKMDTSNGGQKIEFLKKKYVTFANPPSVARVIHVEPSTSAETVLQRQPSIRRKVMKQLIPFFGGIFSKKRGSSGVATA
ncbi:WEB family protein At1g75720 [Primulina huaijiensis]|uniref:WEB family protein At1g75720 n=1 Tax=Primulina huaijiensis TaxID=1492673 RepID=UPI003CC71816